jgi:hypothetical protein
MNCWKPIEQTVGQVLKQKGWPHSDVMVEQICIQLVEHLISGKDFRPGIEEIVDFVMEYDDREAVREHNLAA